MADRRKRGFLLARRRRWAKLWGMDQSFMIEAGTAFGSGGHPSTALALWLMGQLPPDFTPQHVLDVGCGSGVLSVAAAMRWRVPVLASDIAAAAVAQTHANAEANGVGSMVTALRADGCRHPEISHRAPYSLILCNMLADAHIMLARDLTNLCAPQGMLLLSGILRWRMPELLTYYAALDFHPVQHETEGDWAALLLRKPQPSRNWHGNCLVRAYLA